MSHSPPLTRNALTLVTAVSRVSVFEQRLLSSPCAGPGGLRLMAFFNCASAAEAFNAAMDSGLPGRWLVWVHQDVVLPQGWDEKFVQALEHAHAQHNNLAVAGVYGVKGHGASAIRAGHVLDRGVLRKEAAALPCVVDSLDELLFAVRVDSGLRLDPNLGFDFYATDLVLQAQAMGLSSVVVDACCEHWSDTASSGKMPAKTLQRITANGQVFEQKWADHLPLTTPCFDIQKVGDVSRFVREHGIPTDEES